jgi:hypothetical protein
VSHYFIYKFIYKGGGKGIGKCNFIHPSEVDKNSKFLGSCFFGYTTIGMAHSYFSIGKIILAANIPLISFYTIYFYLCVSLYGLLLYRFGPQY